MDSSPTTYKKMLPRDTPDSLFETVSGPANCACRGPVPGGTEMLAHDTNVPPSWSAKTRSRSAPRSGETRYLFEGSRMI